MPSPATPLVWWLREGRTQSQRLLAGEPVVLIERQPGVIVWPPSSAPWSTPPSPAPSPSGADRRDA